MASEQISLSHVFPVWLALNGTALEIGNRWTELPESERKETLAQTAESISVFKEDGCLRRLTPGQLCERVFSFLAPRDARVPLGAGERVGGGAAVARAEEQRPNVAAAASAEPQENGRDVQIGPTPLESWPEIKTRSGIRLFGSMTKEVLVDASSSYKLSLGMANSMGFVCQGDVVGVVKRSGKPDMWRAVVVCLGQRGGNGGPAMVFVADVGDPKLPHAMLQCKKNVLTPDMFVNGHIDNRCTVGELDKVKAVMQQIIEASNGFAKSHEERVRTGEAEPDIDPMEVDSDYNAGRTLMNEWQSAYADSCKGENDALRSENALLKEKNMALAKEIESLRAQLLGERGKGKGKKGQGKVEAHPAVTAAVAPVLQLVKQLNDKVDTSEVAEKEEEGKRLGAIQDDVSQLKAAVRQLSDRVALVLKGDDAGDMGIADVGGKRARGREVKSGRGGKGAGSNSGAGKKLRGGKSGEIQDTLNGGDDEFESGGTPRQSFMYESPVPAAPSPLVFKMAAQQQMPMQQMPLPVAMQHPVPVMQMQYQQQHPQQLQRPDQYAPPPMYYSGRAGPAKRQQLAPPSYNGYEQPTCNHDPNFYCNICLLHH
jgi:hypothetical protein